MVEIVVSSSHLIFWFFFNNENTVILNNNLILNSILILQNILILNNPLSHQWLEDQMSEWPNSVIQLNNRFILCSDRAEFGRFWVCCGKVSYPCGYWEGIWSTYCPLRIPAVGSCSPATALWCWRSCPGKSFQPRPCWFWGQAGRSTGSRPLWIQACGQRNRGLEINRMGRKLRVGRSFLKGSCCSEGWVV